MDISNSIPFVCSDGPIVYELQNQGRVLIIKDALFDPSTQKYHNIELVRSGWKFFGLDWGGGEEFTGITDDVARQIQATYGIVLKTLGKPPAEVAFWGDAKKTSYLAETDGGKKFSSGLIYNAKMSFPFGEKEDDVFLSTEDSALFGATQMTIHDAINAGIWNPTGWSPKTAANAPATSDDKKPPGGPGTNRSAPHSKGKKTGSQAKPGQARHPPAAPASGDDKKSFRTGTNRSAPHRKGKKTGSQAKPDEARYPAAAPASGDDKKSFGTGTNRSAPHRKGMQTGSQAKPGQARYPAAAPASGDDKKSSRSHVSQMRSERARFSAGHPIESFPSIPVYRASSTPIEAGYDDAPFEERKRRIIEHLDSSSPIPFSAFVDKNRERRIHPFLFERMIDALRKLAANPESGDTDAIEMKKLFKHWFRAAYHYLEKNSKPGDGYPHILNKILRRVKDAEKAEIKAKEIYWRKYATDFWMTLIDLFSAERIDIDPFHKSISSKTSIDPWFFESLFD
jgi:hypothetical protein